MLFDALMRMDFEFFRSAWLLIELGGKSVKSVQEVCACMDACVVSPIVTPGLCPLPQMGRLSAKALWRLVPSALQPVTVLWW